MSGDFVPGRPEDVEEYRSHQFRVVLQASPADEPIVLRSTADPNSATTAFHEEFQRLMTQRVTGELFVVNDHDPPTAMLRQPLKRH